MDSVKLKSEEARVLGALMEKEATTPEYYPLSLNALMNASNQKSSRDPVMTLAEDEVRQALHGLERLGFAGAVRGSESRVAKYEHRLAEVFNFRRDESALLCCLLLRGAQTPGELRTRTERIFAFEDTEAVLAGLQKLSAREPALVRQMARQPGSREARWVQLLGGSDEREFAAGAEEISGVRLTDGALEARVAHLEGQVERLREQISALESQLKTETAEGAS
jgi:uncharacterized protein YceH (UPF0502 family)